MRLPSLDEYPDADEFALALSEALRPAPLGGHRRTESREVREWADAAGLSETGESLLAAYNQAADEVPGELREQLGLLAIDETGRTAVIRLLGITGTSDDVRLLALQVLDGQLEKEDVGDFARANLKQRSQVIGPAVEVLAGISAAEALFALAKVFSLRDDEAGSVARRRVNLILKDGLKGDELVLAIAGSEPPPSASVPDPRESLLRAMSLCSESQSALLETDSGRSLVERMAPAALDEGDRVRELSSGSGSLHAYDAMLRDEMIDLVLVTAMPVDDRFRSWARENLFRRENLSRVRELAGVLPGPELLDYSKRALTAQNRRGARADRAVLALDLLRASEPEIRSAMREEAVECLDEENPGLRSEALRLLSIDSEELSAQLRSQISKTFDGLPPEIQTRISSDLQLEGKGPGEHWSFLRWVRGADEGDVPARLEALLERWASQVGSTKPEQAGELIQAFGEGFTRLDEDDRTGLTNDLIGVSSEWIRKQKGRIVEATSALTSWSRFRGIVAANLSEFIGRMRVDQAKGLVKEVLGLREGNPNSELFERLVEQAISEEDVRRVLMPNLVEFVTVDQDAAGEVIGRTSPEASVRILTAALAADIASRSRSRGLEESIRKGIPESLVARQQMVLDALNEAKQAADGNDKIVHLLGEIGRTVEGTDGGQTKESPPSGSSASALGTPPDSVVGWRDSTADRFSDGVSMDGQILAFEVDTLIDENEVLDLIKDLDRRSHSKRVAPVSEREHYQEDLSHLLDAILDSGLVVVDEGEGSLKHNDRLGESGPELVELLDGGRPELRKLFWQRASEKGTGTESSQLGTAIQRCAQQPGDGAALSMLSVALETADDPEAEKAARALNTEQIENAWDASRSILTIDLRREEELRTQESQKENKIGAEMAADFELPFAVIETLLSSYFRLRERLAESGWRRVEERLGRTYRREKLDPALYEIRNDDEGDQFVVKTMGIRFGTQVVSRAIVEPVSRTSPKDEGSGEPIEGDEDE